MAKREKSRADQPLRETEDTAYFAYREWPVLLVLRQKELALHHTPTPPNSVSTPTTDLALTDALSSKS